MVLCLDAFVFPAPPKPRSTFGTVLYLCLCQNWGEGSPKKFFDSCSPYAFGSYPPNKPAHLGFSLFVFPFLRRTVPTFSCQVPKGNTGKPKRKPQRATGPKRATGPRLEGIAFGADPDFNMCRKKYPTRNTKVAGQGTCTANASVYM